MSEYASTMAKYREMEQELSEDAKNMSDRLNRLVIEEEYESYIRDKAEQWQLELRKINVALEWNTQGYWVPVGVEIGYKYECEGINQLKSLLETQLGIPREKQIWYLTE